MSGDNRLFSTRTLSEQAHEAMLKRTREEKPSRFTVGGHIDLLSQKASGGVTYDRTWANGLGLTAYLKAWWHDAAVLPQDKKGVVIGAEGTVKF